MPNKHLYLDVLLQSVMDWSTIWFWFNIV